jgi:hypothetical protein
MEITVQLPDNLAQHADPVREALEAFALESYRTGTLTPYQTRMLLGFRTRYQFDGFLKAHGVDENTYSAEDLKEDAKGFERDAGDLKRSA